ncbi:fimbrial protein [Buttiauxella gaviniae]|uniref:fimbrial protein n=1 Tax=Buttiauxella gaviniae TaxID=82990 RepID=UPI003BB7FA7C
MKFNKIKIFSLRIKHSIITVIILMSSVLGYVDSSYAEDPYMICGPSSTYPQQNATVTINNTSYAGNELPVGSIIYQVRFRSESNIGVACTSSNINARPFQSVRVAQFAKIVNSPLGASFPMADGLVVFPTNVDGVGVTFSAATGGNVFSDITPINYGSGGGTMVTYTDYPGFGTFGDVNLRLIKTGDITSGGVVNANQFPTFVINMEPTDANSALHVTGLPMRTWTVNFAGSVNFVTTTCETPNVNVDMGTYGVSENFDHTGATTPWIDSSIILKGCPTFSGRHANTSTAQSARGSVTATGTNSVATLLTVSLTPASSIIDTANGVMAVDAAGSSGAAATGVGLQLGYTPNNINATATSPSTIWMPGMSWDVQPPNDGTSSFKIPLAARYYQTSNTVTPGPANARVTFNIDYK